MLEEVMVATGKVPREAEIQDTVPLTKLQKTAGICLLLFYLAMIVVTIATLPYASGVDGAGAPLFWWRNSEQ
jgi:hypothetical protein